MTQKVGAGCTLGANTGGEKEIIGLFFETKIPEDALESWISQKIEACLQEDKSCLRFDGSFLILSFPSGIQHEFYVPFELREGLKEFLAKEGDFSVFTENFQFAKVWFVPSACEIAAREERQLYAFE